MLFMYDPKAVRRKYYSYKFKTPADIEKMTIVNHALTMKYEISEVEFNENYLELLFTEENKHTAKLQIFDKDILSCSCEQYCKKQCGCCKHTGLIEYFLAQSWGHNQQEIDFVKYLKKTNKLKPSKTHTYLTFDSLSGNTRKIGNGPIEVDAVSLVTKKSLPDYVSMKNATPVVLAEPYKVGEDVTLYDYQRDILQKMLTSKRAVCSMVMGAGKTLTSIAGMQHLGTENVLIVCPKSIVSQWQNEISRVLGLGSMCLNKRNIKAFATVPNMIGICTYQTLARNIDLLCQKTYNLVIADEIQFIRNDESKAWNAFKQLNTEYYWGLSGTVIENRLDDLYNIMDVIVPGLLAVKWKFDFQFKKLKSMHRTKILYHNEIQNKKDLRALIADNVFSYDALGLQPPVVQTHFVDLDKEAQKQHDYYQYQANLLVSKSLINPLTYGERLMMQAMFLKARQCCNSLELIDKKPCSNDKIKMILKIIRDLHAQNQKIVVYSEWTTMLDIIQREIGASISHVRFDGSMSSKQRAHAISHFRNDSHCAIFFSSDAGGIGIDGLQTVCHNVLHIELPWNPAKLDQRNGRLHRLLQKNQVKVHYVISRNTIESKIHTLLSEKRKVRIDTLF